MRTRSTLCIALLSLLSSAAYAEESSFHNILSVSRTILSPSQYYQLKEGLIVEGDIGSVDGSIEIRSPNLAVDRDIKGSTVGAASFLALSPSLVLGVKADETKRNFTGLTKIDDIWVRPSVTYSPLSALSIAAQVNILRGTRHSSGVPEEKANTNNFTFGMTAHQSEWEATAVLSTKKKDDDNELNSLPQSVGLHARYRIVEPITLGVSYEQRDMTGIAPQGEDLEDETRLGVHMESAMSETFAVEVDYYATTHESGVKNQDGTEFVVLGQALLSSSLEAGAKISYLTIDGNAADIKLVSPGLFISAKF